MGGEEAKDDFYAALLDDDAVALYERAPCGYLSTTPEGTIIKVNQTFLTLTGYQRSDVVGRKRFTDLLTGGGRIYHETHYAPMLRMQGSAREIALDIVCADGRRLPALVNAVLECDASGTPTVVRAAVFDATERRQYERELLRAKERAEVSETQARVLAQTLQQTLIPPAPPEIPGLDVAAAYRPAGAGHEVGGDFYDVFEVAADDWVVALGDVRGKGVEAAVVTALARYTIRAAAVRFPDPSDVLATLNDVLLRHETDRFLTVVLLRLRRSAGRWAVTICAGGHPLPLLQRAGRPLATAGVPGSLLGILDEPLLHDHRLELDPGDALVVYTDGVTEGRGDDGFFGEVRLAAAMALHAGSAASLTAGILEEVLAFQGGNARDDIAVVAIQA